ncbi:hypothetical protein GCM10027517_03130 [Phycicoccus ginsengisoli]
MSYLDTTDLDALEAALEAAAPGTVARVVGAEGNFVLRRVEGGWYLPGDLVIASADVAEGRPGVVELMSDTDEEALLLLADSDSDEAEAPRRQRREH